MFACHQVAPSGCLCNSTCNSCLGGRCVHRQGDSRLQQCMTLNPSYSQPCQVQSAEDVRCIDAELCAIEASLRLKHRLCMIPWIETALGVLNASAICSASPRVAAVAFGCEDFARDLQLPHEVPAAAATPASASHILPCISSFSFQLQASTNHDALRTARSLVAMSARACGVQPLDGPFVKFKDRYHLRSAAVSHCVSHSVQHSAATRNCARADAGVHWEVRHPPRSSACSSSGFQTF
jgi:hypothetical protein